MLLSSAAPAPVLVAIDALARERLLVEEELRSVLAPREGLADSCVQRCMEYAVCGPGQRVRPLLALRIGALCCAPRELVLRAAAAVEMIHCASLVIDDLPCMDNEAYRRNRPSAHVAFGEPIAILAAFALVALAARSILEQPCGDNSRLDAAQRKFQTALLRTLDCGSLVGGQALDLALQGAARESHRGQMNDLKTTPLFLLAAEAGMAYAETPPYPILKRFGEEFGAAFQLTDDYLDDEIESEDILYAQYERALGCLNPFPETARRPLEELIEYLHGRVIEKSRCHR